MTKSPPKTKSLPKSVPKSVLRRGPPYRDITSDEVAKARGTLRGKANTANNALTNYGKIFRGGGMGAQVKRHPMNEAAMTATKKKMMGKGGCGPKKK